jgi:hypothetical protein
MDSPVHLGRATMVRTGGSDTTVSDNWSCKLRVIDQHYALIITPLFSIQAPSIYLLTCVFTTCIMQIFTIGAPHQTVLASPSEREKKLKLIENVGEKNQGFLGEMYRMYVCYTNITL